MVRLSLLLAKQKVTMFAAIPTMHAAATHTPAITANSPDIATPSFSAVHENSLTGRRNKRKRQSFNSVLLALSIVQKER